jgi:hypothetical protein
MHYAPNHDILILDNGSPVPFAENSAFIKEPIVYLDAPILGHQNKVVQNNFNIYTFRYDEQLSHDVGVARQFVDILNFAIIHNYDYLVFIESDALIGFNPREQSSYDFVPCGPWGGYNEGVAQAYMFFSGDILKRVITGSEIYSCSGLDLNGVNYANFLNDLYKTGGGCYMDFAEKGFKKAYWTRRSRYLDCNGPNLSELFLHDTPKQVAINFLIKTALPYNETYIDLLQGAGVA